MRPDGARETGPVRPAREGHASGPQAADTSEPPSLDRLITACEVLMGDVGEASVRAVAARALAAYGELDDSGRTAFFTHVIKEHGVDPDRVRAAFHRWDEARNSGSGGEEELIGLFDAVEPARQRLLRRMNHAPDATLALVGMRADLRRLMRRHPELRPLDHDLHHLLASWFNRGFLRLAEVTPDSPRRLHDHLLRYERVHPMADRAELRRRLEPADRRIHAFFHPATGDVPLIFVEVALVRGTPGEITPLLEPGPALDPREADTAALYSINNALDGLTGISFGSLLIKQVIEQVRERLPHLAHFVTLSPIPGFRRWLDERAGSEADLRELVRDLDAADGPADLDPADTARIRSRLLPALARYIAAEKRDDGRPLDPVARFHLGNGAAVWRLNWPANTSPQAWRQSYGAMVNYRYEPEKLEHRHEDFVRRRTVVLDGPLRDALPDTPGSDT
ncbi:malonyl-CoA decarboxylase domain-containing protein [Nocardiopsis metallicus]|uniref:Malonyl-CoA decarboxylase n=1 Tax=Nocardiopsis metallicus TaxID=179819 RepID=A0A840WK45_9ACTN|nr:malonyl-CoA decarboxylase family protein [Nocardiopsis metallicus]MBB5491986.1 malonyl-CoA decarboxylase [Nocardiopsis metallicus]